MYEVFRKLCRYAISVYMFINVKMFITLIYNVGYNMYEDSRVAVTNIN